MRSQDFVKKLIRALVQLNAIDSDTASDLSRSFEQSEHEQFDDFLLEEGFVDKADLLQALSIVYKVPYMDVSGYFFDTALLRQLPMDVLLRNAIIPYERDENMLLVVAADPSNADLLAIIGEHVSYDIIFNVGIYTDIVDAVRDYYEGSLTEPISEEKSVQNRDLNNLPVGREQRDEEKFLTEKIEQFEKHASAEERKEVQEHAHNAEKHKN
jgi:hypothetical protein